MSLFQNFKIPFWTNYRRRAYENIDALPVGLWFQINETNDLAPLVKKGRYLFEELEEIWVDIQQQYIDEFGLDSKFSLYLKLQKKLIKLEIDAAISEDRHLDNLILIARSDMEAVYNQEKRNFLDNLVLLERSFQIIIDPLTTSVKKYYYYVKHG